MPPKGHYVYDFSGVDLSRNAREIAAEIGCSLQTVYVKRREAGMTKDINDWKTFKRQQKEMRLKAILDYLEKVSQCETSELAKQLELSSKYTYRLIKLLVKSKKVKRIKTKNTFVIKKR